MRRENLDDVAAHPERAAEEIGLGALVLQRHQVGHQLALLDLAALLEREGHGRISFDRADAVDAGHRGDDDDVVALEQRARRRVAHAVDLLVDRGFLLDIGVGARHVGFRLVVVVIGDEIFHRVVGEERLELAVELRRQSFVRREDQRGALRRLDHLGHGEGLAGAGYAQENLRAVVALDAFDQLADRLGLVALRLELGLDHEALAAFGFLRARRPMRRPRHGGNFRPALAQQAFKRIGGGGDAHRRQAVARLRQVGLRQSVFRVAAARDALGFARGFLMRVGRGRVVAQPQFVRQSRIEPGDRRGFVIALRGFAEAFRCRFARLVGGGEIGAAVERIVRRRLQVRAVPCRNPAPRCPC